ncbi:MAG: zinc-ribbon domain-containing protein [Lachnospiraceae bacterium]|nr:zinc-ribbon domain-containing protein [Lachnospiraceae bacterium]
MGLFDDLTKTIAKSGAAVVDKAKEVSEIASATASMEKEKLALEKLYNDLGKKMFENYKEDLAFKFPEEVNKIEESLKKISEAKDNINDKKGNKICPSCGKEIPKGSSFCTACGRRVTKTGSAFCPSCGKEVSKNTAFCPSCGTAIPKVEERKDEAGDNPYGEA